MRIGFMMSYDPERIAFARENGCGCVELTVGPEDHFLPGRDGWKAKAAEVGAAFEEAGLKISAIGGFYVNHMSEDKEKARAAAEMVRRTITLAETLGVGVAAGFSGRLTGRPLAESLPLFRKLWSEHAAFAGDHGVKIAFEHCPMGEYHTPAGGSNMMATPEIWRRAFDAVGSDAIGLEWDPSHLIGLFIDPVANLREFGSRVCHVHAKDARVNRDIVAREGLWAPLAVEHCFPGLGDVDWAGCIRELLRCGYEGDLNVEGRHDAVFRDDDRGRKMEDAGLKLALRHLAQFV